MPAEAWRQLARARPPACDAGAWLPALLRREAASAYLRQYGSPRTVAEFRRRVPLVTYEALQPWLDRMVAGEPDVLFAGRPAAFERTGGSSGGPKLVPYSATGLLDFQRSLLPWLARTVRTHRVSGRAYLAISPATRQPEHICGIPVGLPDGAYLGEEAAAVLCEVSAVPPAVAAIADVERWRAVTLRHLAVAADLELVSVWSPTFLLQLLDGLDDPVALWPRLKVVSCWASAASWPHAQALAQRLPQATLQPKGLLSTECVVTVPDAQSRPVLNPYGFFEFERQGRLLLADELVPGDTYAVVATTASGLYRYRTGDLVRCDGAAASDAPVLEFVGRGALCSDLVGEKLTEPFVDGCLHGVPGLRFLAPRSDARGYLLFTEPGVAVDLEGVERRLCANPQYAYARRLGQLQPLQHQCVTALRERYTRLQLDRGVRLADIKPVALRRERHWQGELA